MSTSDRDWSRALLLLDGPFVSEYLRETVRAHDLPVVQTETVIDLTDLGHGLISEEEARRRLRAEPAPLVLTNSENALGWLGENSDGTAFPARVELFKNKARTRELLRPLYPDFRFREIPADQLASWDAEGLSFPFVIKPAVGFFSLGVQRITDRAHWETARRDLAADLERAAGLFPRQVMDPTVFLAEDCIVGDEYAIDAYFDARGEPVITNILFHEFRSADDVSDRVYSTSAEIMNRWLEPFTRWLAEVGSLAGVCRFPVHVEVRVREDGRILPIEFNPLRFGGWCTTADLTQYSWGFNPYLACLTGHRPDWPAICRERQGRVWSIVVLDNTTGIPGQEVGGFDYAAVEERFHRVLECRRVDYRAYPLFGFLFLETPTNRTAELDAILVSDLREFVVSVDAPPV